MRHIFIFCSPRTGGTWVGKLLDACSEVKYLWESDHPHFHGARHMMNWPVKNPDEFRRRVVAFLPHVDIKPHFAKGDVEAAVYKMAHAFPMVTVGGGRVASWSEDRLIRTRTSLDAKVLHVVRHPTRWAASVHGWAPRPPRIMIKTLDLYTESNVSFHRRHAGEPWYRLVVHDRLTACLRSLISGILDFCGLRPSPALETYLELTHSMDTMGSPHLHQTIMRPATVLNRWKDYHETEVVMHAEELARSAWDGIFEPIVH